MFQIDKKYQTNLNTFFYSIYA